VSIPGWLVLVVERNRVLHPVAFAEEALDMLFCELAGDERPRLLLGNAGLRWYDDGHSHSGRRAVRISRSGS